MNKNILPIITIFIAFLSFSIMDTTTRYTLSNNLFSLELFYAYNKFLAIPIMISMGIFLFGKSFFFIKNKKIVFIRCIILVINTFALTIALKYLSLDIFYAFVFTMPLITMILSIFFLKESFDIIKVIAVILGFLGILIIVQPIFKLDKINIGLLFTFITALTGSLSGIIVKKYIPNENPFSITFYAFIFALIFGILISFNNLKNEIFILPNIKVSILLIINALSTVIGAVLYVKAFQIGEAKTIAPMQYTQMVWGIIFGYFIFNELITFTTLIGCLIIISANFIVALNKKERQNV